LISNFASSRVVNAVTI